MCLFESQKQQHDADNDNNDDETTTTTNLQTPTIIQGGLSQIIIYSSHANGISES